MMRLLLLLFLSTGLVATVRAQQISGTVRFDAAPKTAVKRTPYGRPQAAATASKAEARIAAVWIEKAGTAPASAEPVYLDQKDIQFEPRFVVIRQGEKVRVRNSDPVYHNVFSLSQVKKFDIGRRQKGEFADVQFEKTGVVSVFCDIHSHMNAEVLVLPADALYTATAADGSFRLEGLAPGTYTLKAYAPGSREFSRTITVSGSNQPAIDIQLEAR